MTAFTLSERRACRLIGIARSSWRYESRRDQATGLRERLRALAEQRRRFGDRRLTILLRREGLRVNHKRVYRLYREEGLVVRRRRRKRMVRPAAACLPLPTRLNQLWTMDFIEDRLVTGRKFRAFNVMDAFSRRALASELDTSLPGRRIVQVLDRLADQRGRPEGLVLDSGRSSLAGRSPSGRTPTACGSASSRLASRSRTRTSRASTADSATSA
jgi:putative transposase